MRRNGGLNIGKRYDVMWVFPQVKLNNTFSYGSFYNSVHNAGNTDSNLTITIANAIAIQSHKCIRGNLC